MDAKIIDGIAISKAIRRECRARTRSLEVNHGIIPGLAVILVGTDPASELYVRNKVRACAEVGIRSYQFRFSAEADEVSVISKIEELNHNKDVHGILIQLPIPPQMRLGRVLDSISAEKDVDGFHLYNAGGLIFGKTVFPPCTPFGVMKIFEYENIELEGLNVVIVGASNIVGKPMALMMMQHSATVAVCHAKTRDLAQFTILADILISAAGCPNLILPQMVRRSSPVLAG